MQNSFINLDSQKKKNGLDAKIVSPACHVYGLPMFKTKPVAEF